jgi:tetratricopeptide (TPR) repeat protein
VRNRNCLSPLFMLTLLIILAACQPSAVRDTDRGPHPVAEEGLLASMEYITEKFKDEAGGTQLQANLAILYLHHDDPENALLTAQSIPDVNERDRVLARIGEYQVEHGSREQAHTIAELIRTDYYKSSVLARIAFSYEEEGEYRRGRELAEIIPDPNLKARALADIAVQYNREGYGDLANRIFRQAIQTAETEGSLTHRIETLVYLAIKHNQAGRGREATDLFNEALKFTESIPDAQHSIGSWKTILASFTDAGQPAGVIDRAAKSLGDTQNGADYYRNELLSLIAIAYAKNGSFPKAEEILSDMEDASGRAVLSAHISALYEERGNSTEAKRFFTITQNNIDLVSIPTFKDRSISECARIYIEADQPHQADILARAHSNNATASRLFASLAVSYHNLKERERAENMLREALSILSESRNKYETASAFPDIAEAFLVMGYTLSDMQKEKISKILHSIE